MTSIKLIVNGAKARAEVDGALTSGAVGIPVTIQYDSIWNGLTKNLVCRSGKWGPTGTTRTILSVDSAATVAHEVMIAENHLYLGIEGYNADGTLVIPTTWADCGLIHPGADSDADPSTDPTLPVYKQLEQRIEDLEQNGGGGGSSEDSSQNADEIPDYWEKHLAEKIATIKELQRAGGKDCFSYVVIADYHRYGNQGKRSPVLIEKIMEECGIKFCLCLGDIQNGGSWGTKELELAEWDEIENEFAPIRDRTLMIPGNHDGAYGTADMNGDGVISGTTDYYIYNLTPDEMYNLVYRKVSLIPGVTFDESYNGYYVDDTAAKVRYILINTHYTDGAVNENGTAVNNVMRKMRVGQYQQNMVVMALKTVPTADWRVVVGSHMPLSVFYGEGGSGDLPLLREVLTAYQNKGTYTGTYGAEGNYDYVSVSADFTTAKGAVVGSFAGHLHEDLSSDEYAFPIITTSSDDTSTAKIDHVLAAGEAGTVTEQSFDVFTVNKRTGVMYATKIGYGEDRVFGIGDSYTVTLKLTGANASNEDKLIQKDSSYSNTVTAKTGYSIDSVTVTMGGVDVTADVYADGFITIDSVTGNVVIVVVATAAYTNLADPTSEDWIESASFSSGVIAAASGKNWRATNFIPVTQYDVLRFKGLNITSVDDVYYPRLVLYDESKTYFTLEALTESGTNSIFPVITTDENGVTSYEILIRGSTGEQFIHQDWCTKVKYVRFYCYNDTPAEDVIITVNEEIV